MKFFSRLFGSQPSPPPLLADPAFSGREQALGELGKVSDVAHLRPYLHSRDGFLRQAAAEHAGRLALGGAVPDLVMRLNDWVPHVRLAARDALDRVLPASRADELMHAMPAVYALLNARRTAHASWVATFGCRVLAQAGEAPFLDAMRNGSLHVARAAFRLLAEAGTVAPSVLLAQVVPSSRDIVLVSRVFDHLEKHGHPIGTEDLLRAFRSRVTPVRVRALQGLLARGITERLDEALFARQGPVRAVARAWLVRQGVDVAAMYADAMRAPGVATTRVVLCLTELGMLRQPAHLETVRSCLLHDNPSVRASAALAWFRLAPADKDAVALFAMADPAPRLRKLALQLVRKQGAYIPFERLRLLLQAPADLDLLLSFAEENPWDLLGTMMWHTESLKDQAEAPRPGWNLDRWVSYSAHIRRKPTEQQRAWLVPLLERGALREIAMDESTRAKLAQLLEQAGLPCV